MIAAALDEFRGLAGFAYPGEWDEAGPRLLAALDAVLARPAQWEAKADRSASLSVQAHGSAGRDATQVLLSEARARLARRFSDELRAAVLASLTGENGTSG